jgi:hypothetical protein
MCESREPSGRCNERAINGYAVLMIVVPAIIWAIASSTEDAKVATEARAGVLVALGAAVLSGAGVAWINRLIQLGEHL